MKVTIAYIEEPPFGWKEPDRGAIGADIDLADAVLRTIGVSRIEHHLTTFSELLPGVEAGRWDMNVPLFVTPERADKVAFSLPVWAIGDGFLVRTGNPKRLNSYAALAERDDARLGIIAGQVQHETAMASGVSKEQIVIFEQQADAIEAVQSGEIDAYASTAVGNRILANRVGGSVLEAVEHEQGQSGMQHLPLGAFSFNRRSSDLLNAVNKQLRLYLGSPNHRARMASFGLTHKEIDPALNPLNRSGHVDV
ncbi:transporter substrate-binding domain-containing protein [Caballeronia sp. SEWSISQ10-4 2]|uniref:transporter substrate-binding domain-containing protein n=1 Tax=Caballeronia sp. SEWSISQ10-4 2 TaxID=2937438 RepID=UPI00265499BF|nr:transporter substrate-binding domain-containing protein [Caballeronia sp. SEWSISQ10-4 2]MDN7182181.1 transporter substrate-binding domain-containing protein [Caballeronia sp. SEWSISQ10-4 2]